MVLATYRRLAQDIAVVVFSSGVAFGLAKTSFYTNPIVGIISIVNIRIKKIKY